MSTATSSKGFVVIIGCNSPARFGTLALTLQHLGHAATH